MNFDTLIEKVSNMTGNYTRGSDEIYIHPTNIEKIQESLNSCDEVKSILITPFLLNLKNNALYELHYYEFEIEVKDVSKAHFVEYVQGNCLPQEIIENIKPKLIVAANDKNAYGTALSEYFNAMSNMKFELEKSKIHDFNDFNLYYQVY